MRIAILGFGLMGGSVARALHVRAVPGWSIAAWSPSGMGPARAADDGVIARAGENAAMTIEGADLVLLAAPPLACLDLLSELAGPLRAALPPGAVVTDVASTKRRIMDRARELDLPFAGGHPMAGRETAGYDSADKDLFAGRPWVICSASDSRADVVTALATAVGAEPMRLDAAQHDEAVAGISHLPLIVAAALVEAVAGTTGERAAWPLARRLAASGWRDTTRLARGDVEMAAGIVATNRDLLSARVREFRDVLDAWLAELDGGPAGEPDLDSLRRRLGAARARLEADAGE